jgi:ribosome-associated translation inhibitor RaiA/cold shock CspA family protein
MQVPLRINFHNMPTSEAMAARVEERVARLERLCDSLISCRITLEAPHKKGPSRTVGITIDIAVPGKEIVVKREQRQHQSKGDAYQVIGLAFDAAERQIEDYLRVSRRDVKTHADGPTYARIVQLYPDQNYGFIETPVQLNVYFHRTVVGNGDFDALEVGSEVLYTLAGDEGPMGPQASKVQLVKGAHPVR